MTFSINWLFSKHRWRMFLLFGLMTLVGCGRSLDPKVTEKTLKEELVKQGVGSLKQVSCPGDLKAGQKFDCLGIFESGIGFKIPVEQKGDNDKLLWEIPSIKGMLNMNQVMNAIRSELKLSEGAIDCGTNSTYRMATLGSTFECVLTVSSSVSEGKAGAKDEPDAQIAKSTDSKLPTPKEPSKPAKEPDKVEITIASSGDVTWQRLVAGAAATGSLVKPKTPEVPTETPDAKAKESPKSKSANGTAPAAEADVPYDS
jgi:hypothetical protein